MVDVFIRNVDEETYAQFKADAARRKITAAQEFKLAFTHLKIKKGLAKDLLLLPTFKGDSPEIRNASKNIDKAFSQGVADDYLRHKRPSGTST